MQRLGMKPNRKGGKQMGNNLGEDHVHPIGEEQAKLVDVVQQLNKGKTRKYH